MRGIWRSRRRFAFSPTPERLKDFTEIFEWINIFGTVTTLLWVATIPYHFFRRLNSRGESALRASQTPVKTLVHTAALVALVWSEHPKETPHSHLISLLVPEHFNIVVTLIGLSIAAPLWLGVVCLLGEIFWNGVALFAGPALLGGSFFIVVGVLLREWSKAGEIFATMVLISTPLVLLPRRELRRCRLVIFYFSLSWKRYRLAVAYLISAIAFFSVLMMLALALGLVLLDAASRHNSDTLVGGIVALVLFYWIGLCLAFRLLVSSYAAVLDESARYPRRSFYASRCKSIVGLGKFLYRLDRIQKKRRLAGKLPDKKLEDRICVSRTLILEAARMCLRENAATEARLRQLPTLFEVARAEVKAGLSELVDVTPCLADKSDCDDFYALVSLRGSRCNMQLVLSDGK